MPPLHDPRCSAECPPLDYTRDDIIALYERLKNGTTTYEDHDYIAAGLYNGRPINFAQGEVPPKEEPMPRILARSPSPSRPRKFGRDLCARHPKACRKGAAAAPATPEEDPRGPEPPVPTISHHRFNRDTAATRALKTLSAAWCKSSEGCIASDWSPSSLPPHLAASLLHGGTSKAIACFDLSRGSEAQDQQVARCPRRNSSSAPVFEGEFGFELLHALPYLNWLSACGMLGRTSGRQGMKPFYFFSSNGFGERQCGTRPARSRWKQGSLPRGNLDGWSWSGRHSLQFYAYPSPRWLPPPLHRQYRGLPLPPRDAMRSVGGGKYGFSKRVWLQNKYYPEGHGTADNFWSLDELRLILDTLLGCNAQVIYNHPELSLLGATDVNDQGKGGKGFALGDQQLLKKKYSSHIATGALLLLPHLARTEWRAVSYNEVQLRVLSKSSCFLAPQGGASYLTFYQPGLHVVNDKTGKERCVSANLASDGKAGTYWHYYTRLASDAGESIIYNVNGNRTRLKAALDVMCRTEVCQDEPGLLD